MIPGCSPITRPSLMSLLLHGQRASLGTPGTTPGVRSPRAATPPSALAAAQRRHQQQQQLQQQQQMHPQQQQHLEMTYILLNELFKRVMREIPPEVAQLHGEHLHVRVKAALTRGIVLQHALPPLCANPVAVIVAALENPNVWDDHQKLEDIAGSQQAGLAAGRLQQSATQASAELQQGVNTSSLDLQLGSNMASSGLQQASTPEAMAAAAPAPVLAPAARASAASSSMFITLNNHEEEEVSAFGRGRGRGSSAAPGRGSKKAGAAGRGSGGTKAAGRGGRGSEAAGHKGRGTEAAGGRGTGAAGGGARDNEAAGCGGRGTEAAWGGGRGADAAGRGGRGTRAAGRGGRKRTAADMESNPSGESGQAWTEDEDVRLINILGLHRRDGSINFVGWGKVAQDFPGHQEKTVRTRASKLYRSYLLIKDYVGQTGGSPDFRSLPDSSRGLSTQQKEALARGELRTKRDVLGNDNLFLTKEAYDLLDQYLYADRTREPAVVAVAGSATGVEQRQASWRQRDATYLRHAPKTRQRDSVQGPTHAAESRVRSDRSYVMAGRRTSLFDAKADLRRVRLEQTMSRSLQFLLQGTGGIVPEGLKQELASLEAEKKMAQEAVEEAAEDMQMTEAAFQNALAEFEPPGVLAQERPNMEADASVQARDAGQQDATIGIDEVGRAGDSVVREGNGGTTEGNLGPSSGGGAVNERTGAAAEGDIGAGSGGSNVVSRGAGGEGVVTNSGGANNRGVSNGVDIGENLGGEGGLNRGNEGVCSAVSPSLFEEDLERLVRGEDVLGDMCPNTQLW
ncbi:hypothetical protein DUNSADRAFT_4521 [Dunaliella salina]|uniref:Myb-like domain-containing protein n=1 Tax=Dunaliella salina TaxID=3046 RepID=A0ABQ7GRS4_DUNSA|nr:hypothetical protein DUNSADRAFT_4521 [Dunaliella salina]|eukprot:KAF5837313.1 hypothetical protein DUNSADRAFT_4521 [Dunaliella salina]